MSSSRCISTTRREPCTARLQVRWSDAGSKRGGHRQQRHRAAGVHGDGRRRGLPAGEDSTRPVLRRNVRSCHRTARVRLERYPPGQPGSTRRTWFRAALGIVRGTARSRAARWPRSRAGRSLSHQISESGRPLPPLKTTTSVDGSWSFPGTSRGTFKVSARKASVQGVTSAAGRDRARRADRGGPARRDDAAGRSPAASKGRCSMPTARARPTAASKSATPDRCSRNVPPARVTTDADGFYSVDDVPLGRFPWPRLGQIEQERRPALRRHGARRRRPQGGCSDGGAHGHQRNRDPMPMAVPRPARSSRWMGSPATGCSGPCTQGVKPADGTFSFVDVPARTFTVSALDPVTGAERRGRRHPESGRT